MVYSAQDPAAVKGQTVSDSSMGPAATGKASGEDRNAADGDGKSAEGEERRPGQDADSSQENTGYDQQPRYDCDALWKAVFEDGEAAKGSFYIIGSGAALTDIGQYEFTVTASSEHVKSHAENNRQLLEDLMEKHTGKRRTMKVVMKGESSGSKNGRQAEDIAREAGDILGIDVEIR